MWRYYCTSQSQLTIEPSENRFFEGILLNVAITINCRTFKNYFKILIDFCAGLIAHNYHN